MTLVPKKGQAFGESLGIEVPTRYDVKTHDSFDTLLVADSLLTPILFGMSRPTLWVCRLLAGLLVIMRVESNDLTLHKRLQIEAMIGIGLIVFALRGTLTRRPLENLYLFAGGVSIIANCLMTQVDQE